MSLNKKIKNEREDIEDSSEGGLLTTWILGGIIVGACILGKSCEKDKPLEYNKSSKEKIETNYQKNFYLNYLARNINYFNNKN